MAAADDNNDSYTPTFAFLNPAVQAATERAVMAAEIRTLEKRQDAILDKEQKAFETAVDSIRNGEDSLAEATQPSLEKVQQETKATREECQKELAGIAIRIKKLQEHAEELDRRWAGE